MIKKQTGDVKAHAHIDGNVKNRLSRSERHVYPMG
jgi:hypothetical protein